MERESPKCVTTNGFLILFQDNSCTDDQSTFTSIDVRLHKGKIFYAFSRYKYNLNLLNKYSFSF